jgi:hypothetical protein
MKRIKKLYIVFDCWYNKYLFTNELCNLFLSSNYRQKLYEDMFWYRTPGADWNIYNHSILRESFDNNIKQYF